MAQVYGMCDGSSGIPQGLQQLRHSLQALFIGNVCWGSVGRCGALCLRACMAGLADLLC